MRFFLILFVFFTQISFAEPMCEKFYNKVYNEGSYKDFNVDKKIKTIGIRLLKYFNHDRKIINSQNNEVISPGWSLKTDKDGYFKVGKITSQYLFKFSKPDKLKVNDTILSINGIDLRELAKDPIKLKILESDVSLLFKENEKITFKFKRGEEIFEISHLQIGNKKFDHLNIVYSVDEPAIDFFVNSISVNEKNGSFFATINTSFLETLDEKHTISKIVWDTLVDDKKYNDEGELVNFYWYQCNFDNDRWQKLDTIDPAYGIKIKNVISENKNLKSSSYNVKPRIEEKGGNAFYENVSSVKYDSKGVYEISNKFNLRKFPFDKQKLEVFLYNDKYIADDFRSLVTDYTQKKILAFKKENQIQGWNVNSVDLQYKFYTDDTKEDLHDGISLQIDIERKYWYYVFKVILPIILILTICWSSIWIDPREVESRLTITIVCLLSLIAYNFVIDKDIPKLDYLTVMDFIILISYLYAAIPNLLAVLSHNMIKTKNKDILEYEEIQKRFGLPSYLIIVFGTILYNVF